jgi:hypothetical protein
MNRGVFIDLKGKEIWFWGSNNETDGFEISVKRSGMVCVLVVYF